MRELTPPLTPLLEVLRQCTTDEQHELAMLAGTKRNYLYQLATCRRRATKLDMAYAISEAVTKMHVRSLGRIPKISVDELAKMCLKCSL